MTKPTPATVARHAIAMTAECIAAALGRRGSDQASHRSSVRIRRWANLWFFDEYSSIGNSAHVSALGVLAWALKIASSPDAPLLPEELLPEIPVERSFDAFLQSACLRDAEEMDTARRRLEEKLWNYWRAFKDVSSLREQVRALRWLLGAAVRWQDVPVSLTRHELPPPDVAPRALLSRLDVAWKKLRTKFRQPLPGPVSEEKVDAAEREIGRRFPPDLRASFLRHGAESYPPIGLLSLESALESWRRLDTWTLQGDEPVWANEPAHPPDGASRDDSLRNVKSGSWRRGWFPLTSDELDSDFHGADLDPAPGGVAGQVFYWSHEIPGPECIMERSFTEWLEWAETADEFESADE